MSRLLALCVLFALFTNSCKSPELVDNNSEFEKFRDNFIEELWKLYPTYASSLGYYKYHDQLTIPGPDAIEKENVFANSYLDSLNTYESKELNTANRVDLELIKNFLESSLWYNNEYKSYTWDPSNYNLGGVIAEQLYKTYAPLNERLLAISSRLDKIPAYYEAEKKNISKPTIEHTELGIAQNKGSIPVFGSDMKDSVRISTLSNEQKDLLYSRIDAAKESIVSYINWLENTVKPGLTGDNVRSFRLGKELYNKKFELEIQSSFTADEIYTIAEKRKAELTNEMYTISHSLWNKYFPGKEQPLDSLLVIRSVIDTVSKFHVHRDSFMTAIEKQIPELVEFVNNKKLLYLDPSKPLIVRKTPGYMDGVAGASISSPGPYEKGENTYYNVSPLDSYSPEAAESYLREYNHYILQILNIHEAIPGHYAQLVYSNQSPSLVKSVFGNGTMVEGWAVYTERMMLEEGYGNNEPEMWLMYYKWHLRSVCNTILDYSVHCKGMEKADALDLLINKAFQQKAEAENKWKRVTLTNVQLCSYFTGYHEIYKLREEIKQKRDNQFDLKSFHEEFLGYGSAPVKYIRKMMMSK